MKMESIKSDTQKGGVLITTLLFAVVVVFSLYLVRLYGLGVPVKSVVFYEKGELARGNIEDLDITVPHKSGKVEEVIVISKKDDDKHVVTLYSKEFSETKNVDNPASMKELLLQLASGSGNAYAQACHHPCQNIVIMYGGEVFAYCKCD
jgi:hypothetical protein